MVVKSSFRAGAITTPKATAKGPTHAVGDSLLPATTLSDPADAMYPFSIKQLGLSETYVLYAPSASNRREWCGKIREAQEHYASALATRNSNPFRLKVLSNLFSALRGVRPLKLSAGRIRGTPLDRAIEESPPESHIGDLIDTNVLCVDTFRSILVVGTENGIYTLDEANTTNWGRRCDLVCCNNQTLRSRS